MQAVPDAAYSIATATLRRNRLRYSHAPIGLAAPIPASRTRTPSVQPSTCAVPRASMLGNVGRGRGHDEAGGRSDGGREPARRRGGQDTP